MKMQRCLNNDSHQQDIAVDCITIKGNGRRASKQLGGTRHKAGRIVCIPHTLRTTHGYWGGRPSDDARPCILDFMASVDFA